MSSNCYAFLAIVAHYVRNDGQYGMNCSQFLNYVSLIFHVEELLIDFYELMGAHSGENMAAVVWSTLELYGIENRVHMSTAILTLFSLTIWQS